MKAAQIVRLVCERKAPSPDWTRTSGIYADLSSWPHVVDYYVKCPECGHLHGSYKTMKEAHAKRLCQLCDLDRVEKLKKEIEKVDESSDDPFYPSSSDIKKALYQYAGDWVTQARLELERETNLSFTISDDLDYTDADDWDKVELKADHSHINYTLYRSEDVAEKEALERVKQDIENEPELFSEGVLDQFVDEEKLAEALGDPYEDFGEELNDLSYTELLERMSEEGKIDYDDSEFYDEDGEPLPHSPERAQKLESIKDEWIAENKPEFDPMQYLEDSYGKDAMKEILKLNVINIDAAASYCVRSDGWSHFLSGYSDDYSVLDHGVVAIRTS